MPQSTTPRTSRRATPADAAVGERLKALRQAAGLTQEDLATRVGVSYQMVQKIEKGASRISAGRLQQFAAIIGCTGSDILGEGAGTGIPEMHREHLDLVRDFSAISDSTDREAVRGLVRKLASKTPAADAEPV
jgi:transcriptional regulator with XRE-family HTH domain